MYPGPLCAISFKARNHAGEFKVKKSTLQVWNVNLKAKEFVARSSLLSLRKIALVMSSRDAECGTKKLNFIVLLRRCKFSFIGCLKASFEAFHKYLQFRGRNCFRDKSAIDQNTKSLGGKHLNNIPSNGEEDKEDRREKQWKNSRLHSILGRGGIGSKMH